VRYVEFLEYKAQLGEDHGFSPLWMPDFLFDFQQSLVEWSLRKGRSALFADCGLGKTPMQLVWAENVVRKTNGRVLILTPLAVAQQTLREAVKFDIECHSAANGKLSDGINIVNYDRLHYFDSSDIAGIVCDESAILKSFDGVTRSVITQFMKKIPYRLLCTATPSPNEYTELGTSSEALGYLGYMDMLSRFFKNEQGNSIKPHRSALRPQRNDRDILDTGKWRFKGHAEQPFWRWACSWARAVRKPSDLGFDDGRFVLPSLEEIHHTVKTATLPDGYLFPRVAQGLSEQREERRRTLDERCGWAADLVKGTGQPAAVWCQLNDEGDLLAKLIPDAVQVSGKDKDEAKEEKFLAFISGQARVLVIKPKIGAWGLNFQHCAHTVSFPSHSFEQYYQSIRRFWRFGQVRPVKSDIVATEGDGSTLENLRRKAAASDRMFSDLVSSMHDALGIQRSRIFTKQEEIPSWL
jgi:hypothetical protein